ncbi:MAG: hypothetical protein E4H09_03865, partial [Spirochaetales bacterium]
MQARGLMALLIALSLCGPVSAVDLPSGIALGSFPADLFQFGWSRDGKFAYLWVQDTPFREGLGLRYAIIDAVTDREVWSLYDHTDQYDWDGVTPPAALSLERNAKDLEAAFASAGIVQVPGSAVGRFPLEQSTGRYDVAVAERRVNPDSSPYRNDIVGYRLTVTSRGIGTK